MNPAEPPTVALSAEDAAFIGTTVATGDFASAEDVVHAALRLLRDARAEIAIPDDELRRVWQEGIDSGDAGPLDIEEIKRKARARLNARVDEPAR